jgi:hypothetical protein
MWAAMRVLRGVCFAIGVLLIIVGVVAAAYGISCMSFLTETTGLVTEGLPVTHSAYPDSRAMVYRYAVDGRNYSGMTSLPLRALQDKAGRLNRTIRIFYPRWHPSTSYALYRPSLMRWFQLSAFIGLLGVLAIVFQWKVDI